MLTAIIHHGHNGWQKVMHPPPKDVNGLFRENAIKHLNAVEDLQKTLKVVNPADWWGIVVVVLILLAILLWGLFGRVYLSVEGSGILLTGTDIKKSEHIINQLVNGRLGMAARLEELYKKKKLMYEKHYLTLDELLKAEKDYLIAQEDVDGPDKLLLAKTQSSMQMSHINTDLQALIFVDHVQGKKITQGMQAYLLPKNQSQYNHNYIKGRVLTVSNYPISKQLAYAYLGNMNLIDDFFISGAPFLVKIALEQDSVSDPEAGCIVNAKIIFNKVSPIQFI
ncbi:MAG: hypothetical protein ACYC0J_00240 [Gammaproteobacteria bacterium]